MVAEGRGATVAALDVVAAAEATEVLIAEGGKAAPDI